MKAAAPSRLVCTQCYAVDFCVCLSVLFMTEVQCRMKSHSSVVVCTNLQSKVILSSLCVECGFLIPCFHGRHLKNYLSSYLFVGGNPLLLSG